MVQFFSLFFLISGTLSLLAAAPGPIPRHDPPEQSIRRAPMAESARTVVVPLQTNLFAAFDTELCRIHTLWRGKPLNLWGPPYSHSKSPFICDFEGETIFRFPALSPWFTQDQNLEPHFRGMRLTDNGVQFEFEFSVSGKLVSVIETIEGAATAEQWTGRRTFAFPEGTPAPLRYLADAKVPDSNVSIHLMTEPEDLRVTIETKPGEFHTPPPITEANTERLEPPVLHSGPQRRAFVEVPAKNETFSFSILMGNGTRPMPVPRQLPQETPAIFPPASERRQDSGDSHYRIEHFPLPPEAEMIITGMDWLNETDLAVCTWLGEIYIVENAVGPVAEARYRRFARGLNEPLGLSVMNGDIFVVQKGELTRLADTDNDGLADWFECVNDNWGYSGNYHSYSFGPLETGPGEFMVFVTGQRGRYDLLYQGWAIEVGRNGVKPFCSGLRVPHGWGTFKGDIFVTDNQGNWIGACRLNHLQEGKFYGFPSSRPAPKGVRPASEVEPPVLWFPRSLSPSTSGFDVITNDQFGPFKGQMLIGDFQNSIVMRASLEKVRGRWQGAVFPFAKGFLSGVNRLKMGADGNLYVAGGKRTWSTAAPKEYSLERVSYTGSLPFEVARVRVVNGGFELQFTKALEADPALDPDNYLVKQFTYRYHEAYGSPEYDQDGNEGATETPVDKITLSEDGKTVLLTIPGLKAGFVTSFQLAVNSAEDEDLRNDLAYYTLNELPD